MPKYDEDKTPAETINAKKSSGAWKFNIAGALCARPTCNHRRDKHKMDGFVARACTICGCLHFVVGGMSVDEQRADTEREMLAVREDSQEKK